MLSTPDTSISAVETGKGINSCDGEYDFGTKMEGSAKVLLSLLGLVTLNGEFVKKGPSDSVRVIIGPTSLMIRFCPSSGAVGVVLSKSVSRLRFRRELETSDVKFPDCKAFLSGLCLLGLFTFLLDEFSLFPLLLSFFRLSGRLLKESLDLRLSLTFCTDFFSLDSFSVADSFEF